MRMKWFATGLLLAGGAGLRDLGEVPALLRRRVHRGRDGRRARRLVRGGGAVPPAAQPADPAHRDHPAQQGAHRARAFGVHPAQLPLRRGAGAAHRRVPARAHAVPLAAAAGERGHRRHLRLALPRLRARRGRRRSACSASCSARCRPACARSTSPARRRSCSTSSPRTSATTRCSTPRSAASTTCWRRRTRGASSPPRWRRARRC